MIITEIIVRKIDSETGDEINRRVITYGNLYESEGFTGQLVLDIAKGAMVGNQIEHTHLTWKELKS